MWWQQQHKLWLQHLPEAAALQELELDVPLLLDGVVLQGLVGQVTLLQQLRKLKLVLMLPVVGGRRVLDDWVERRQRRLLGGRGHAGRLPKAPASTSFGESSNSSSGNGGKRGPGVKRSSKSSSSRSESSSRKSCSRSLGGFKAGSYDGTCQGVSSAPGGSAEGGSSSSGRECCSGCRKPRVQHVLELLKGGLGPLSSLQAAKSGLHISLTVLLCCCQDQDAATQAAASIATTTAATAAAADVDGDEQHQESCGSLTAEDVAWLEDEVLGLSRRDMMSSAEKLALAGHGKAAVEGAGGRARAFHLGMFCVKFLVLRLDPQVAGLLQGAGKRVRIAGHCKRVGVSVRQSGVVGGDGVWCVEQDRVMQVLQKGGVYGKLRRRMNRVMLRGLLGRGLVWAASIACAHCCGTLLQRRRGQDSQNL
jgi:hypothetical protein